MIPFAIPLALKTLPWKWIGIGAGVIAVLLGLWWLVDSIGDAREEKVRAEYEAAQRAAEAKAQADSWTLVGNINDIDTSLSADFAQTQQTRTIYRDRIRTVAVDVYRDRQCDLPAGVWSDLNAIRAATSRPFAGADQ